MPAAAYSAEKQIEKAAIAAFQKKIDKTYPAKIAGFERGARVKVHAEDFSDYSVPYHFDDPKNPVIITFYQYPTHNDHTANSPDENDHYEWVKQDIVTTTTLAELVSEDRLVIKNHGKEYNARRAAFIMTTNFLGNVQKVYSEVIIIEDGGDYLMVRGSTPVASREMATKKNLEFFSEVKWFGR